MRLCINIPYFVYLLILTYTLYLGNIYFYGNDINSTDNILVYWYRA